MNYRSIALAFFGIIVYYSLYGAINPIILSFTGDNSFVEFLTKVIPLVIFFAIIFSAFTGNDAKNYKYSYLLVCGGVFLLFASPVTAGLTDNLIRAYDYQNMSYTDLTGNGADFSMYNFFIDSNNGTMVGFDTITFTAGHSSDVSSLSFDGVDDKIEIGSELFNPINTSNEFTISLNFNTNTVESFDRIINLFGQTNRVTIDIFLNNLRFQFYDEALTVTQLNIGSITNNIDYFVTVTYDGSTIKGYIDGVLLLDNSDYPGITITEGVSYIGSKGTAEFFYGSIYNVLIYDRALSQYEITEIYQVGQYAQFTPISDGLVFQHTLSSDYIDIATNTSIDTKRFTHDTLTNTTRLKFNTTVGTYLYTNSDLNDYISISNDRTISFFENITQSSPQIFMIKNSLARNIFLSHYHISSGTNFRTGVYDTNLGYQTSVTTENFNEYRNILIGLNSTNLDNNKFYYDSIQQSTGTDGMTLKATGGLYIGEEFYGYFNNFMVWDVNNLTEFQIKLINGGWSYNNRHKTGIAVQNIFSEDFYDDYIIQIKDLTTNTKTNYTPTRDVVFVNLDDARTYNITAININDDFANANIEVTGTELEVLFEVYDYNSIFINVYDEETKDLITENITLKYSNTLTTTIVNDTGSFYLTNLTSGEYLLNLFGDDYLSRYYYVSVVNNANASLNAYLLKTTSSLSRAVNVLCGSSPVEDALISFYIAYDPGSYTLVAQRNTDGFGQANFFLNPDTTYRLVIEDGEDIYISSVIPTSTPITVNICQDSDQPYNYTTQRDLFSTLISPSDKLLDIEATNFTLDVVSDGYINAMGIYATYNGVDYTQDLIGSTSGGSVRIEIPISTAQDIINIYWYINTTSNETYNGFEIYKTKLFTEKGNSSFYQVFEDYDTEFSGYWKYVFITFIAGMSMLLTSKLVPPQYNGYVGLAVFVFFGYIGWIAWAYVIPMGAILILYSVVRR